MKVVDIERVIILMRFIQFGWTEERKKAFDEDLRMMLETQCEDLADHDKQIRDGVIDEFVSKLKKKSEDCYIDNYCGDAEFTLERVIDSIAEQMKGEQNERNQGSKKESL